jgi:hypothetical protein
MRSFWQHLVINQLARPGAPVVYGAFTSNVDMKSGSPAFGTPEYVKASWGAGQLARKLGLPWRSSAPTASNAPDAQGAYETQLSLWGAIQGGANIIAHTAGWLEGGLTASYEKFILDVEVAQMVAEICQPSPFDEAELALDAIREVGPGGHFFGCQHTMERYANGVLHTAGVGLEQLWPVDRRRARLRPPSAPTASGSRCWRIIRHRRRTRPSLKRLKTMCSAASPKAARYRNRDGRR